MATFNTRDEEILYRTAATKILDELEIRGFSVNDPAVVEGLENKIMNIILETIRGNTNYCVTTKSGNEIEQSLKSWIRAHRTGESLKVPEEDGTIKIEIEDGDLENQGPPDNEDYPLWRNTHPYEN